MRIRSIVILSALMVCGCATKHYGRLAPISPLEAQQYDCRELAIEISKVDAFEQQVKDQSHFNGRSLLADVNDFGIGNAQEKSDALKSADNRRHDLQMLYAQHNCPVTVPAAPAH